MRQFTTETDEIIVEGVDLTTADVYVTYGQGSRVVTIENPEVAYSGSDSTITVSLTQDETGLFGTGAVRRQVNWVTDEGRWATDIVTIKVAQNLLKEAKEYVGPQPELGPEPEPEPDAEQSDEEPNG